MPHPAGDRHAMPLPILVRRTANGSADQIAFGHRACLQAAGGEQAGDRFGGPSDTCAPLSRTSSRPGVRRAPLVPGATEVMCVENGAGVVAGALRASGYRRVSQYRQ